MGFEASFGNFNWQQPMMNNFNYGWNNNSFNWNTPNWGASVWSNTSSVSSKQETADEYEARIKKENAEKLEKIKTLFAQKQEGNKALQQLQEQKTALNGTEKEDGSVEVKGTVQADGTIQEEKLENMSTGAKIMRGGMNLLQGLGNVCKSLVGFDSETGKWDPVKCVRNVAIGVGVGALCAFAAPLGAAAAAALGGGAIAAGVGTAISCIPAALATAGVATGAYMAGKGIVDTKKALDNNDLEAFDKGTQDVGAGAFIGITSAFGLRSMSKAASLSASTEQALVNIADAGAGTGAATKVSFLSKIASSTGNFFKDIAVNPWKAGYSNYKNAASIMAEAGGGAKGFAAACKNSWQKPLENAKKEFEGVSQKASSKLMEEAQQLQLKIAQAETPQERVLLEMQLENLNSTFQNFSQNAARKNGWSNLTDSFKDSVKALKDAKKVIKENGSVEFRGQKFTLEDVSKLESQIKTLVSQKNAMKKTINSMKPSAFKVAMQGALRGEQNDAAFAKNFGFSTKWYAQPWNWIQSKYYGFVKPTTKLGWGMKALNASLYVTEPYFLAQGAVGSAAAMPMNAMFAYNPVRTKEADATTVIPAEQYAQAKSEYEAQEKQIKEALNQIDSQLKALTA